MTVKYMGEREQFGVKSDLPGGAAALRRMAIDLEGARHVTRQALWRLAEGLPNREVAIAKVYGRAPTATSR
jgi:alkylation response protein AidB-like acyl-CoA dehydrogenase